MSIKKNNPVGSEKLKYTREKHSAARYHPKVETLNMVAFLGDSAMTLLGLLFGFWFRFRSGVKLFIDKYWASGEQSVEINLESYFGLIVVGVILMGCAFIKTGLYRTRNLLRYQRVLVIVTRCAAFWIFIYVSTSLVLKFNPPISRVYAVISMFGAVFAVLAWRALYYYAIRVCNIAPLLRQRVVFVGWSKDAGNLAKAIFNDSSHPYEIVGCVRPEFGQYAMDPSNLIEQLGEYSDLPEILDKKAIEIVILSQDLGNQNSAINLANLCERLMVQFKVIPSYFQIMVSGLKLETISTVPILGVAELPLDHLSNKILKRAVDILGGTVGIIVSIPIVMIFGVLIYVESPGPIFYHQIRAGRRGREFKIIKLRSMRIDAESNGAQWAKKDDDRRLKIGAFMRAYNIDEVPQFWNVIKGDMSLVGPRPERPELISKFQFLIPHYNARLISKPGMTGWAQVNGLRGDTDLSERVRYDLYYLENWSIILDLQIMIQTFIKQKNAY